MCFSDDAFFREVPPEVRRSAEEFIAAPWSQEMHRKTRDFWHLENHLKSSLLPHFPLQNGNPQPIGRGILKSVFVFFFGGGHDSGRKHVIMTHAPEHVIVNSTFQIYLTPFFQKNRGKLEISIKGT